MTVDCELDWGGRFSVSPMPRFRPDIAAISPYEPGRPINDVAREMGFEPEEIIKLASNESPGGPLPEVVAAIAAAAGGANRYPDNDTHDLSRELSSHLEVPSSHLWIGGGSTALISVLALAVGGPGTSAVYAWPSFIMYRLATRWAMSDAVEVPLADGYVHDLNAMAAAVGADTSVVYVCNPNNPTGTHLPASDLSAFVDSIPESVLVVIDEAYHDFVAASDYASAIPLATDRANVVVLRTFSKVHALAGLRVGYAVAHPATIAELRKAQAPFTVTLLGQVAAAESLRQKVAIAKRVLANATGRAHLLEALAARDFPHAPSETNFVFFRVGDDSVKAAELFTAQGVIVRPLSGGWTRVTVGFPEENERFVEVIDSAPFRIFRGGS